MTVPADGSCPLVTIGIPLYRARPFVDRIVHNIQSIDYPELEFIVADQHGLDDATELLRERVGDDARVRLFETTDELDWIRNYNFVLRQATGKYFRLLAQDDVIPPASLSAAVACLEGAPEVSVVDGPVDAIDVNGGIVRRDRDASRRGRRPSRWARFDALLLFAGWRHDGANLGLVRRAVAVDNGLYIPHTQGMTGLSVRAWLFALALRGRVRTVADYTNQRCIHPESFTARHRGRSAGDQIRRLASYLKVGLRSWNDARGSVAERLWGPPALFVAAFFLLPLRRAWQRFSR